MVILLKQQAANIRVLNFKVNAANPVVPQIVLTHCLVRVVIPLFMQVVAHTNYKDIMNSKTIFFILFINLFKFASASASVVDTVHSDTLKKVSYNIAPYYDHLRCSVGMGECFQSNSNEKYDESPTYFSLGVNVSYYFDFSVITLQYYYSNTRGTDALANNYADDLGLLYGIRFHIKNFSASLNAGIEYVNLLSSYYDTTTSIQSWSPTTHSNVIGLPWQIRLIYNTSDNFGLGFNVFGSFNSIFQHAGFLFDIEFGIL